MKLLFTIVILVFGVYLNTNSKILRVGASQQYANLNSAASVALPGDTIIFMDKNIQGGMYLSDLNGLPGKYITITSASRTVISGGSNAIQLSEVNWLVISNFILEGQSGNGLNIDDGGSYDSPTTNIIIQDIEFWELSVGGNNDQLKMSGVDSFLVTNCTFSNGSAGGSMIDMVGCHKGVIRNNQFINGGSNAIQAKGASSDITIMQNTFKNAGQRAINIGGSTGAAYFRPLNAKYESTDIKVWSNFFTGSLAPIAFVGTTNSEVVNNTIYNPDKWVIRILQENIEQGMELCANNRFINNIVVIANKASNPSVNIGANTVPESFQFHNNLWYNFENLGWNGPNLPSPNINAILNVNPKIKDIQNGDMRLLSGSPAIGKGKDIILPDFDFYGHQYRKPRSIGAAEDTISTDVFDNLSSDVLLISPNPASDYIEISSPPLERGSGGVAPVNIFDVIGMEITTPNLTPPLSEGEGVVRLDVSSLSPGVYFIRVGDIVSKFVKM
jgi:hypothetical protein